jgi:hypothetical protein
MVMDKMSSLKTGTNAQSNPFLQKIAVSKCQFAANGAFGTDFGRKFTATRTPHPRGTSAPSPQGEGRK